MKYLILEKKKLLCEMWQAGQPQLCPRLQAIVWTITTEIA
jgi:hypothetical protein